MDNAKKYGIKLAQGKDDIHSIPSRSLRRWFKKRARRIARLFVKNEVQQEQ